MGKYDAVRRLSQKDINELFIDFTKALATIRNSVEAAQFIKDILTESEVVIIARRLQIARLLEAGLTYEDIHKEMRVGNSTVAKVHAWMDLYGEGFRTIIKRTKKESPSPEKDRNPISWDAHKRKYPMHYWPEMLLKAIVESARAKERKKLLEVIEGLKSKSKLAKEIEELLRSSPNSHTPAYGS